MKKKKRTTKRTPTGSSSAVLSRLRIFSCALALALLCPLILSAKKEKTKAPVAFAVLAGTVYRPPGFALAGVTVLVSPEAAAVGGVKLEKSEAVTNGRGEWAIRVPPVPANWRVDVKHNGYRPEQRSVSIEGEQRIELSIVLEPAHPPKETKQ